MLFLPTLIFAALPNILFGYDNAAADDIIQLTEKAYSIDAAYKDVKNYDQEETDRIVAELAAAYSEEYGSTPDEIEVNADTDNTNIYWFIAITSVAHKQDLYDMDEDTIKSMARLAQKPQMKARGNTLRAIADRLSEEAETTRQYLDLCGLEVLDPDYADNAVLELLYETINKRTARRVKLPDGVFDMLTAVHGIYNTQQ